MRTPVLPGSTSEHQIYLILSLLGKPENSFVQQARKRCFRHLLSNSTERYVTCKHTQFREHFPNASDGALSLLMSCLSFDPKDRITAKEALLLPYFTNYDGIPYTTAITTQRSGDGEFCIDMEELKAEFSFEEHTLTVEELRTELLQEIQKYRGGNGDVEGMRGEGSGGEYKETSTPMAYTDGSSDDDEDEDDEDEEDGSMGSAIDEDMDITGSIVMDIAGDRPPCCYRPRGQEPGSTRIKRSTIPPSTFISSPISTKISTPRITRPPLDILHTTTPLGSTLIQQQQQSSLAIGTDTSSNQSGATSTHQTARQGGFGRTKIGQQQQQQQQQQQEDGRQGRNKFQDFFHNMCKQS